MNKTKNIMFWILSVFFLISGLVFLPSVAGIFMILLAFWIAPINKLQKKLKSLFPQKWIKTLITAILVIVSIVLAPTDDISEQQSPAHGDTEITQTVEDEQEETPESEVTETPEPEITETPEPEITETPEPEITETPEPEITETPEVMNPPADEKEEVKESYFAIHFVDVGQADAALVICDGRYMLIDGGNAADSSLIYTYLKKQGAEHIDIMVATHAHEDHVGGLAGALNYASVDKVLSPVTSYDSDTFRSFVKYVESENAEITVPKVGDTMSLGSAEIKILAVNSDDDTNNTSIVLKVIYGETSFVFTGDAEREAEQVMLDSGADLSANVLKVGHHGSETSTSYVFLREVAPEYAVISVGEGNSYGHPTEEVLSRLRDADVKTFRTDLQGDIICESDGKSISFTTRKNDSINTLQEVKKEQDNLQYTTVGYIVNKNTGKFHYPTCNSVAKMSEKNKLVFEGTRDEAVGQGYSPCGNCNP